jgi:hypothetical protein
MEMNIVEKEIRMKSGKALGPGTIPVELIKNCDPNLLDLITSLFNKVINIKEIPQEQKMRNRLM